MATIDRHYFQVCTRGARRQGRSITALVAGTGLDPVDFERPGWRGPAEAMALLVRNIWASLEDEFMGYASRAVMPGSFAFAFGLALEGRDVADGLRRAARFFNLLATGIETRIADDATGLAIEVHFAAPERDPDQYFSEFWMIIWHRLACWLAGETIPLVAATFDYPRPDGYLDEFRYLFPCPHRFDAATRRIILDEHVCHAPIRRSDAELRAMVAAAPLDIMTIPASDASWARRIRRLLVRDPALTLKDLAEQAALLPHTLRRRLNDEGTNLATLREAVRREIAIRLLTGNATVEAVADALGYAEARSFTRAFRHWTGHSPSAWRARSA